MKLKIWKIFIPLLISILLQLYPITISNGCGGWDGDPDEDPYSFFQPNLINEPLFEPFFFARPNRWRITDRPPYDRDDVNKYEWIDYLGDELNLNDITGALYYSKEKDLTDLWDYINNQNKQLDDKWSDNKLINRFINKKDLDVLKYFIYAKKCEPHATWYGYWDDESRDTSAIKTLIIEGKKSYNDYQTDYLKLRYAYQVIRLSHYIAEYEAVVWLHDKLAANLDVNSVVKYWCLSHKAGALYHLDKKAKAIRLFAVVFDKCPDKRFRVLESIKITDSITWNQSINLCENTREKTTLWLLLGMEEYSHGLEAMENIYKLDTKSDQLELLLVREIEKIEENLLPNRYGNNFFNTSDKQNIYINEYVNQVREFIANCAKKRNTSQPDLWYFAAGYLSYLTDDENSMKEYFKKAKRKARDNKRLLDQIHIIEIINKIDNTDIIDIAFEKEILEDIKWLRNNRSGLKSGVVKEYLMKNMASLYSKDNNYIRAELCISNYDYLLFIENVSIDEMLAFFNKEDKTEFEIYMLSRLSYSKDDLIEMQGTSLLDEYRFKGAIKKFETMSEKNLKSNKESYILPADPFLIHINDCHDCDFKAEKDTIYTKLTFAKRMVELMELAEKDTNNAAEYYFLLANAFYNMSYFGNSWMITGRGRNHQRYSYSDPSRYIYKYKYNENIEDIDIDIYLNEDDILRYPEDTDMDITLYYYLKAIKHAKNDKLEAKYCFMASKCEQNQYYEDVENKKKGIAKKYRKFFKLLHDKYADTKYYSEVIKECKYFRYFVSK